MNIKNQHKISYKRVYINTVFSPGHLVPLFVERKVCLEKNLHIWNQHFISYKMVPILITLKKVVEVLYFEHLTNINLLQKIVKNITKSSLNRFETEYLKHICFFGL